MYAFIALGGKDRGYGPKSEESCIFGGDATDIV